MGTNYIAPIWRMPRNANKDKLSNYSINIGAAGEYIDTNTSLDTSYTSLTLSAWVKYDSLVNYEGTLFGQWITNTFSSSTLLAYVEPSGVNKVFKVYWGPTTSNPLTSTTSLQTDVWYHIVITWDGNNIKLFIDGTEEDSQVKTSINNSTQTLKIGAYINASQTAYIGELNGQVSQACLFDYALTDGTGGTTNQIGYLYNLNNPMVPGTVNLTAPVAYLPLGDNSNPNAPGSFPNISVGADSVFDFAPSIKDYIIADVDGTAGSDSSFELGSDLEFTVSFWFKRSSSSSQIGLFQWANVSSSGSPFLLIQQNSNNLRVYYDGGYRTSIVTSQNIWYHITITRTAIDNTLRAYLNSSEWFSYDDGGTPILQNLATNIYFGNGYQNYFIGQLSNGQIWNTALSPTEIETLYNNGQPLMTGTQPQEANLQAWYKLNQSANYDPGVGPFSIEKVGSPDDGSGNGCFTSGGQLKWIDTNSQLLSENDYFTFLSPLILCNSTDVDLSSTGGSFQSASSQLEYALEYSIDGGSWTTWKTQVVSSGTSVTNWTVSAASNLTCNSSIQVRLRATGGLFGTSQFNWNDLEIKVNNNRVYFETFGTNGLGWTNGSYTAPTDNYIDPSWQIPDNRSAYPQSFDFSKTPQEYIDLGKDDWFNEYNNEITFSLWVNKKDWASTGFESIISKYGNAGAAIQYRIAYPNLSGRLQFYLQGGIGDGNYGARIDTVTLTSAQQASEWLHILWRHNANTGVSEVIFNGDYTNLVSLTTIAARPYARPQTTTTNMIGNVANGLQPFDGAISNYQRFNSFLDNATVQALYNDGVPSTTAIATDNLKAWYKLNDNEKFDGTNWSIENQKYPASYESALDFDGNDNILIGSPSAIQNLTNITLSVWVKVANTFSIPYYTVASKGEYAASGSQWYLTIKTGNGAPGGTFAIYKTSDSTSATSVQYTTNIDDNKWHNIVCINDGTDLKVYVDGQLDSTSAGNGGNIYNGNRDLKIGRLTASNIRNFDGLMSNMVIWGDSQETEVSNIYNNGTPATSYTNTPVAWWKLNNTTTGIQDSIGSNDGTNNGATKVNTFVSTEAVLSSTLTEQSLVNNNVSVLNGESEGMNSTNLVTSNISRTQPYSNYSFNFDRGQADFFDLGTDSSMDVFSSDFSCSVWFNHTDASGGANSILEFSTFTQKFGMQLGFTTNTGVSFSFGPNPSQPWSYNGGSGYNDGNWHNFIVTKNGSSLKGYVDGVELTFSTGSIVLGGFNAIGKGRNTPTYFNGKLSNCCLFDRSLTEQEILKIYNNGLTQDLQTTSSFSNNIAAWWPMDENSSYYDGTDWIIRDLENGNDGDGNNTGNVDDLVGNAPGSEANGTGNNLVIGDLKNNMKDSTLNTHSINMGDYADGVTNPANSGRSTDTP